jgi:hypothetical protein
MANKTNDVSNWTKSPAMFLAGKEQTDAMLRLQKELLEAYEQTSRAWLARVKSEIDLWSELAARLAAVPSPPHAMQAFQECATRRMAMAAEDGRRLLEECQEIMRKISRASELQSEGK